MTAFFKAPHASCSHNTLFSAALIAALGSSAVHAVPQDPAITLDAVNVSADKSADAEEGTPERVAGAVNRIQLSNTDRRLTDSADVFAFQAGINVQSPGNEGAKISIRGSGINRGPGAHASGISVSLDGLPLSGPGGTPYELLEPLWLAAVEVLRGANGLERGALALGGAINYISRTGRDSAGTALQYHLGSRGYQKRSLGYGGGTDAFDYYLAYTDTQFDGYQQHARGDGSGAMLNLGWQLHPQLETRLYLRHRQSHHQTPGRLTRAQIRDSPRTANPANLAIDAQRPQPGSSWIGSSTVWQIDEASSLQGGVVYHSYPMDLNESLYRQQLDYSNLNLTLDYRQRHTLFGRDSQTRTGLRITHDLDADVRETLRRPNNGYAIGTHTRDFSHHGTDSTLHISNELSVNNTFRLQTGLALINIRRDVEVRWPINDERLSRNQWDYAPRLGFTWQQTPHRQWFGNLSRSVEPAHPWSMIWGSPLYFPAGYGPSSGRQRAAVNLDNQTATTLEIGARGQSRFGEWELAAYHSQVRHELLTVELQPLPDLFIAESNASPTLHRGIEAALDSTLWQAGSSRLGVQQTYTFSDFRYRNDRDFNRKQLPGLPRHHYQAQLRYDHAGGTYTALSAQYASAMPVDYASTFRTDRYLVLGYRLGYQAPSGKWNSWLELRNLTDRRYAAAVTPGYDDKGQDLARSASGEGASVYAGVSFRFQ